jgi:hypothetical protein
MLLNKRTNLLSMLIWLTLLAVAAQLSLFFLHFKTSNLLDSLVQSALATQMWHPVIIWPIVGFVFLQIISCVLFITWVWFITNSCGNFLRFSKNTIYTLGLFIWLCMCCAIVTFNSLYFSDSFFAELFRMYGLYNHDYHKIIFIVSILCVATTTMIAYLNYFVRKHYLMLGGIFLILGCLNISLFFYEYYIPSSKTSLHQQPNIIFIGLDSVRPDYIHYFGNTNSHTPNIDAFLQSSTIFTQAYTPLARTFPAWMSILSSQYPKHNHARSNLADPTFILPNDTLAKHLQQAGYETFYITDEKRFSNILNGYGFDKIIGPSMGVNDFLLGTLSDFPFTNLLINMPLGRFIFPYNYANRAAAVTYEPNTFLHLIQLALAKKQDKPLFLSIHLCTPHWPFTWAHDKQSINLTIDQRYTRSIEEVDRQLGELISMLKSDGLLNNTLVVLLSDHGTTLGLLGDRLIDEKNYQGDMKKMKWLPTFKLSSSTDKHIHFNTAYGQGTDILSLKQYHVLMAFQGFGIKTVKHSVNTPTSLLDITPTILDFLKLSPLITSDGSTLLPYITNVFSHKSTLSRALFLETGYSLAEIEKSHISIADVVKHSINTYQIDPSNGLLFVSQTAEKSINKNKQRAVLLGDWLLARYPDSIRYTLIRDPENHSQLILASEMISAYFVLANVKTGKWTVGFTSALAKQAPLMKLQQLFNDFYGDEV